MNHPNVPCNDPNCRGCRWWMANQKAIEKRMKPQEPKPQPSYRRTEG